MSFLICFCSFSSPLNVISYRFTFELLLSCRFESMLEDNDSALLSFFYRVGTSLNPSNYCVLMLKNYIGSALFALKLFRYSLFWFLFIWLASWMFCSMSFKIYSWEWASLGLLISWREVVWLTFSWHLFESFNFILGYNLSVSSSSMIC